MFTSVFQNLPTRKQLQKYILTKLNCNIVQFLFNLSINFTKSSETLSLTLLNQGLQKQVKILVQSFHQNPNVMIIGLIKTLKTKYKL